MFTNSEQSLWKSYNHVRYTTLLDESVTYQVPNSPKIIMSDFYMLSYLDTINFGKLAQKGNIEALRFDDDFKEDLEYARSVLYPFLKRHMENAVFFALCAEIRHIFDHTQTPEVIKKYSPFIQIYHKYYRHYNEGIGQYDARKPKADEFAQDKRGYTDSYAAVVKTMKQLKVTPAFIVTKMEGLYHEAQWAGSYGGPAWANIAESWLKLYNTKETDYPNLAVIIDHIYDLQHNTDTVFNKLKSYYNENDGYSWIKKALDFKANLKNIRELLPTCSSLMIKLARPILKAANIKNPNEIVTTAIQPVSGHTLSDKSLGNLIAFATMELIRKNAEILADTLIDDPASFKESNAAKNVMDFIEQYNIKDPSLLASHPYVEFIIDCAADNLSHSDKNTVAAIYPIDDFTPFVDSMYGNVYRYSADNWKLLFTAVKNKAPDAFVLSIAHGTKDYAHKLITLFSPQKTTQSVKHDDSLVKSVMKILIAQAKKLSATHKNLNSAKNICADMAAIVLAKKVNSNAVVVEDYIDIEKIKTFMPSFNPKTYDSWYSLFFQYIYEEPVSSALENALKDNSSNVPVPVPSKSEISGKFIAFLPKIVKEALDYAHEHVLDPYEANQNKETIENAKHIMNSDFATAEKFIDICFSIMASHLDNNPDLAKEVFSFDNFTEFSGNMTNKNFNYSYASWWRLFHNIYSQYESYILETFKQLISDYYKQKENNTPKKAFDTKKYQQGALILLSKGLESAIHRAIVLPHKSVGLSILNDFIEEIDSGYWPTTFQGVKVLAIERIPHILHLPNTNLIELFPEDDFSYYVQGMVGSNYAYSIEAWKKFVDKATFDNKAVVAAFKRAIKPHKTNIIAKYKKLDKPDDDMPLNA